MTEDSEPLTFNTADEWREWLSMNHNKVKEAWVILQNAGSPAHGLRYTEALDEALAYCWIDGLMHSFGKGRVVQRYTPRRPGSHWSELNKERVARLTLAGRMADAGLAAVEAAKRSGKW